MKNRIRKNQITKLKTLGVVTLILLATVFVIAGCSGNEKNDEQNHQAANMQEVWTCPMHPQVISDRPGVCPICHMDLVKKTETEIDSDTSGLLNLSGRKQVLANVSTVVVKKEKYQNDVVAYSYMDFAENNRKTISARFNGRIEKLFVDKTGDYIKKGEPLFEIYSPDLVQAQNDYLIALNNSSSSSNLLNAARKKLEIFGLTSNQINELEKREEASITLTYYSPFSGTVIEKEVQEGMYVNEGTSIYDIAELSTLWNIAEVYEKDLANIKVGNTVKLKLRAYPGQEFEGKVTFIYPVINPQTRTVKVRSEFSSNGGKLKPQMYGETVFRSAEGEGLLVPVDAVIIAGKRSVVWIKDSNGMFEARNVVLGNRFEDKYQIVSGLKEGEEIVATGGFLIDSESQLRSSTMPAHQHSEIKKMEDTDQEKLHNHNKNNMSGKNEEQSGKAGIFNAVCPVLGNKVSLKVKPVEYKGKLIGFCCPGCDRKFIENPEKYMKNLSEDGKIFLGNKASN
ncbi:MAG: efflux RND transporter periplasmic adaptor subunit [Ignavibacteriales bacterium]|nr:MAG: efflux RND transporter periplasmic adaptor subunit [Ignavibacteriales bacterium]